MSNLTEEQKIVLEFYKLLGARWLAVDSSGEEQFYISKPTRDTRFWQKGKDDYYWDNLRQWRNSQKGSLGLISWKDEPVSINWLLGKDELDYWESVPIDTKVEVYLEADNKWVKRHYAGLKDGSPTVFASGNTSWSEYCGKVKIDFKDIRVCE